MGLAMGYRIRGEESAVGKEAAKACQLKREPRLLELALRGNTHGNARHGNACDRPGGAGYRLELPAKCLGALALVSSEPARRQRAGELRLDTQHDLAEQQPLIVAASFRQRRRQTLG